MTELKPCPFCGEKAEFVLEGAIVGRVRCKCCRVTQTFLRPMLDTSEEGCGVIVTHWMPLPEPPKGE